MSIRYRSYTAVKISIAVTDKNENRAAGLTYSVSDICVCNWQNSGSHRVFCGQKAKFLQVDEKLCEYVDYKRHSSFTV